MNSSKLLVSIEGPTASGKTALAVSLAHHFKTEIVSSDSRQCYREMTIGTAVPSLEERQGIEHHLIHSHSASESLSAGSFAAQAHIHLDSIFSHHNIALLVGGSPLYAAAILKGLDELPVVDASIINQTREASLDQLQQTLKNVDFETYTQIDLMNRRRLERAVQIYKQTGSPLSDFRSKPKPTPRYRYIRFQIDWPRNELYSRINERANTMFTNGLVSEAQKLWPCTSEVINSTVGYFELFGYLEKKYTLEQAKALIQQHSRNFAKRQITWYRKSSDISVLSPTNALEDALFQIKYLLQDENPPREY